MAWKTTSKGKKEHQKYFPGKKKTAVERVVDYFGSTLY